MCMHTQRPFLRAMRPPFYNSVMSAPQDLTNLKPGALIDDYEIIRAFARGGMATLYLAKRKGPAGFERQVAIKVLNPEVNEQPHLKASLIKEAKLSSYVRHPHVIHIEDLIEVGSTYALVMEYVDGWSLERMLAALAEDHRKMAPALIVAIAAQVAQGLHAVHEACDERGTPLRIVHRDVSPQNVLINNHGFVKLIDFGIAKSVVVGEQTASKILKGKLAYMAPEQATGRALDRRTDIYALGILLWEMFTMREFIESDDQDIMLLDARSPQLKPISLYNPDVPLEVERVIMQTLAPDPTARPATALDLSDRLLAALPAANAIDPQHIAALLGALAADEQARQKAAQANQHRPSRPTDVDPYLSGTNGQRYILSPAKTRLVIGRAPECDIVLDDPDCSRQHAELVRQDNQWLLRDLASKNGIYVAHHKVPEIVLAHGMKVRLGKTEFRFEADDTIGNASFTAHKEPL